MSKAKKILVACLTATVLLIALFVTILLLSLPIGENPSLLPISALYLTGGVAGGSFLAASLLFFLRIRRGG